MCRKTVSLVLGSGGARGLAHIGVIRWLEAHDYSIKSISGSSMGALIGGLYACGKMDEYEDWLSQLSNTETLALMDIAWDKSGLIKGDKLFAKLKKMTHDPTIESLPIAFTAVATDINQQKQVWFQKGSLIDAVRASTALPMVFTPFKYKNQTLIDGGVLNPIPIAPTFADHCDLTIAVNPGAESYPENLPNTALESFNKPGHNSNQSTHKSKRDLPEWLQSLNQTLSKVTSTIRLGNKKIEAPFSLDILEISNKAFDAMQNNLARQQLAAYPPDITLDISRDACGMLEFSKIKEMVTLGYQTAEHTLAQNKSETSS